MVLFLLISACSTESVHGIAGVQIMALPRIFQVTRTGPWHKGHQCSSGWRSSNQGSAKPPWLKAARRRYSLPADRSPGLVHRILFRLLFIKVLDDIRQ
jgi:hypothetical protein